MDITDVTKQKNRLTSLMTTNPPIDDQIREVGIVEAGGAGFPTYVKLAAEADTVLINAAECGPAPTLGGFE